MLENVSRDQQVRMPEALDDLRDGRNRFGGRIIEPMAGMDFEAEAAGELPISRIFDSFVRPGSCSIVARISGTCGFGFQALSQLYCV